MSGNTYRIASYCLLTLASVASVQATPIGEPTGSFGLRLMQGNTTIVDANVNVPTDLSIYDGDGEDYVQIGSIGNAPIILKIVSEGDADFRILHWYIDVPGSLNNIYESGGTSLFDPSNNGLISLEIMNLAFTNTTGVTPMVIGNSTFMTQFMRDTSSANGGRFYVEPLGTYFAPGVLSSEPQVQVAGQWFTDADKTLYNFSTSSLFSPTASWKWESIPGTQGLNTISSSGPMPSDAGKVFELGLAVGFVGIPEPGTLGLLIPGLLIMCLPRRRA